MLKNLKSVLKNATVVGSLALVGCGASTGGVPGKDAGCPAGCPAVDAGCPAGCPQSPPMGTEAAADAWLAKGEYKTWKCEAASHPGRSPSPHGPNRICNNTKLSGTAAGNYPVGAASVKELFVTDGGTAISGYAYGVKIAAGASTGASWYWFEKNGGSLIANGKGDKAGNELTVCTGCHQGAGSDAAHSGRDFVYTQVP